MPMMYIEIHTGKTQPEGFNTSGAIQFKEESENLLVQNELSQGRMCSTGSTNQQKKNL